MVIAESQLMCCMMEVAHAKGALSAEAQLELALTLVFGRHPSYVSPSPGSAPPTHCSPSLFLASRRHTASNPTLCITCTDPTKQGFC